MSQTCSTTIISLFPNTEQSSVVAKITIRKRRKRQKSAKEQTQKEELKPKVVNFADLMQQINTQLDKTAEAMKQNDQALSKNFGIQNS